MNILYVLYDNFISNSSIQVHGFACAMSELGHECIVAVPHKKETAKKYLGERLPYTPAEYSEIENQDIVFSGGKKPDVIHAWTPRENVRIECEYLKNRFQQSKLIIHLEDNEEVILSKYSGLPFDILRKLPNFVIHKMIPGHLSHPKNFKAFLRKADGITIIMDTLQEVIPKDKKKHVLWPIIDTDVFCPDKKKTAFRHELGIKPDDTVIAYIGNVHKTNVNEVKSLYKAVGLANRNELSVKIIRAGLDTCSFLKWSGRALRKHSINLGFIANKKIPDILNISDILIQPGKSGDFNDFRLPSKIPEFLATGKPVVLPETNLGRFLKNNEEAIILKKGNAEEIADVIMRVKEDKELAKALGEGARRFAVKNFDKGRIAGGLEKFYLDILQHACPK